MCVSYEVQASLENRVNLSVSLGLCITPSRLNQRYMYDRRILGNLPTLALIKEHQSPLMYLREAVFFDR